MWEWEDDVVCDWGLGTDLDRYVRLHKHQSYLLGPPEYHGYAPSLEILSPSILLALVAWWLGDLGLCCLYCICCSCFWLGSY